LSLPLDFHAFPPNQGWSPDLPSDPLAGKIKEISRSSPTPVKAKHSTWHL
jgi:hypothetical protein